MDLIYLDPPFNKGKQFYGSKCRDMGEICFNDTWNEKSEGEEWHKVFKSTHPSLHKYLENVGNISNDFYQILPNFYSGKTIANASHTKSGWQHLLTL